jgi:hypothetical protein
MRSKEERIDDYKEEKMEDGERIVMNYERILVNRPIEMAVYSNKSVFEGSWRLV